MLKVGVTTAPRETYYTSKLPARLTKETHTTTESILSRGTELPGKPIHQVKRGQQNMVEGEGRLYVGRNLKRWLTAAIDLVDRSLTAT